MEKRGAEIFIQRIYVGMSVLLQHFQQLCPAFLHGERERCMHGGHPTHQQQPCSFIVTGLGLDGGMQWRLLLQAPCFY
jgi:hypothetical protein